MTTIDDSENSPELWDAKDVARYLKASRSWVYQRAEAGLLPCVRLGGLLRFDPEKIRAYARGELRTPKILPFPALPGVPGKAG